MSASRCIETSLFYQKTLKFTIVWQKKGTGIFSPQEDTAS